VGGLLGGTLFGIGMTLAGGCGAGSMAAARRGAGEAVGGRRVLRVGRVRPRGWPSAARLAKLGVAVFLPAVVGWGAALLLVMAVAAAWALAATWNEDTRKFAGTRLNRCYLTVAVQRPWQFQGGTSWHG